MPGMYFLTKDYFNFTERLATVNESKRLNLLPDNHPTLQNMLGEDSEGTRRSVGRNIPNPTTMNGQLFQINEAVEDEDRFSPTKGQQH